MSTAKDYATMTPDELMCEEKKLKSQKVLTAVLIGFLIGIAVWSATHEGGFILTVALLIFALTIGSSYNKKRKSLQAEISRQNIVN